MDRLKSNSNINNKCPEDAPRVPASLIEKYGHNIASVWWYAKGRDKDPTIGVEIDGVRKTFGGYTYQDWWYFMKTVHEGSDETGPQCYVYRKKKVPDPSSEREFEVIEEYIGPEFIDPDTNLPLPIVHELKHAYEDLCY